MSDRYLLPRRQLHQVGGGEAQIDSLDIGGRNRLQPTIDSLARLKQPHQLGANGETHLDAWRHVVPASEVDAGEAEVDG